MANLKEKSTIGGEYIYDLAFVNGTQTVFQQASAPTGWTRLTEYNDTALRVVNGNSWSGEGTGGTQSFSTIFNSSVAVNGIISAEPLSGSIVETNPASININGTLTINSHTLSISEVPSHAHSTGDNGHYHYFTDQY